ncbi:LysR substrate-binding domain-containing protein [Shinella sp. BYT-45]|uniref:LysR substrate-binding domain-containing protein n=1 Tax=Shinella sp. BYT-45 TaxID=3377377 RepID=UPI003980BAE7
MSKLRYMLPSTQSLFVFEAAARNLNFKLAAAELNVTQPSISHAIKALERHCNVDLFVRDNRGVQLTEAGRLLYDSVRSGFQRIEHSLKTITARDTQYITVAASTSLAAHWLVPKLPIFQQRHPGIKIKIVTTDRDVEPDHQVDMTIWLRPRNFERPNSWYMCEEVIYPVCTPSYLASAPPLKSVEDLARHQLIHSSDPHRKRMGWSEWLGIFGVASAEAEPDLVFNDYQLAIQAALAGEGVVLGWAITTHLLRRNRLLVRPLMEELTTENAFFVIANERSSKTEEMKLLVDWVVEEARAS